MWQLVLECMRQRHVALCIPVNGEAVPLVFWYGVLASVGIFVGAWYATRHVAAEGENPDIIWDALLWLLIPALLGARLWYVGQAVLGGSTAFSLSRPLEILNPRTGGMNIFGGALAGFIAVIVYTRVKKIDGWLIADAGLMGLLLGQGIGRIGNFINQELYGPPTNSEWFGMRVAESARLPQYPVSQFPLDTRFHPTMFYEMFWLFLVFAILYTIFRRYQERIVPGIMTGAYFILTGIGRFVIEYFRPDQPHPRTPTGQEFFLSYSQIVTIFYILMGVFILLDRMGHFRIPFISRPLGRREREKQFEEIELNRKRRERAEERERIREQRRKQRERAAD